MRVGLIGLLLYFLMETSSEDQDRSCIGIFMPQLYQSIMESRSLLLINFYIDYLNALMILFVIFDSEISSYLPSTSVLIQYYVELQEKVS